MPWQRSKYISGSENGRVLNMQELQRVLIMPKYGWICLNRTWTYLNMSAFTIIDRVLNMSHTMHSVRSLYKLISTYWEMGVFRTLSRSKIERFGKIIIAFNYFRKRLSILNLWEGPKYMVGFKYIRVLNIPGYSILQGTEFPALHRFYIFS